MRVMDWMVLVVSFRANAASTVVMRVGHDRQFVSGAQIASKPAMFWKRSHEAGLIGATIFADTAGLASGLVFPAPCADMNW